jgi:hypothetical protein
MKSRDQTSVLLSVAAIRTAFNEFKADGTALFLVVECKESVELDIAIVKSKNGLKALIEDNSSCSVTSWSQMDNGQWSLLTGLGSSVSDKQSIESNRSKLPIYYGETLTCKRFGIYVPASTESSSLAIVECGGP